MQSPYDTLVTDEPTLSADLMHMLCAADNDGPHLSDENMGDETVPYPSGFSFDVNDWV